jgi:hypothetical protein
MSESKTMTFNAPQSRALRDAGMAQAALFPWDEPIARARNIAIMLGKRHGETHADMVHQYLLEHCPEVLEGLQPASWGSVFKTPKLEFTGRIRESEKVSRHAGMQRIWRYVK